MLIEFESVVEAVRCAASLRDAVAQMNQALLPERRVALRIGINLDDIIVKDGDVFGDGVNIAARLAVYACGRAAPIAQSRNFGRQSSSTQALPSPR